MSQRLLKLDNVKYLHFFLIPFLFTIALTINAKTVYYVKTDGAGNGSSWANAANNIQTMIDKAVSGDEVWVAKGTYYPTTETIARDSRSRTFAIKSEVNLYGGFAGSESLISQRALADLNLDGKVDSYELVNATILSGDIDGVADVWSKTTNTDGTWSWTVTGNSGNCYNVVTARSNINGFSVIGGNANGTNSVNQYGGGIYSSSLVSNCTVSNCSASSGGGIYSNSSPSIYSVTNCSVSNCSATSGGGIYSTPSNPYFSCVNNCTVSNCSATNGGGIYSSSNSYSSTVTNCSVINCSASSGGGIYSYSNSIVSNCTIINCSASSGGGIYSNSDSAAASSVSNCTVSNCSATNGGGICSYSTSYSSTVTNCTVSNCSASYGGGIYSYSFCHVTNCTVSNCSASFGGGIYSSSNSSYVANCASSNNSTGGLTSSGLSGGTLSGCFSPSISVAYIQPTSFIGVASTDAQKSELTTANWRIKKGSPCINAGATNSESINISYGNDNDNNPRVLYGTIDIGAYEYVVPKISMPIVENFNNWTDFNINQTFYQSASLITQNDIKWTIINQKADFSWQTNLTTTYSQPIFTYQIDATKSSKVYLRYDMYFQAYAGTISPLGTEKLNVEFSTDLVTWSTIATYSNANGTIANQTYKHDISTLAAGKTFFIRFNANGANTNRIEKWEIDNVIIDADGLSAVNTIQENKYKYSVNNGVLNIANVGQIATIQLFDINGKNLVNKVESQSVNLTLPVHGVYIVKVVSDSGIENKKIVW